MKRAQLIIGQSHVAAFRAAAQSRRTRDPEAFRTRVIHTLEPRWAPETSGDALSPALAEAIRDQVERHDPVIASVIGGNGHNALALLAHPRAYDIRLIEEGAPPFAADAEPVPVRLVTATLAQVLAADLARMRMLRTLVGPFTQIESPPPVRDDAFILAHADAFFAEQGIASQGVAPAGLRYRMWRLASEVVAAQAAELGCRYLRVPAEARDDFGFLPTALAADATHGNEAYGEIMIRALDKL